MYSFLYTTLTDSDLLPACDGIEQSWLSSDTETHRPESLLLLLVLQHLQGIVHAMTEH